MMVRTVRNLNTKSDGGFLANWRRSFSVSRQPVIDMASKDGELRVFIVAGEVSGDNIGSRLMASLKKLSPMPIRFAGVGGLMMSNQGLKSLFPMEDISVMGIWELLPHLNKLRVNLKQTMEAALLFKPHVIVTVDSKGFSFRFLKQLRARYDQQALVSLPPHFHYVAPSFWAWKGAEKRLKALSEFIDHVFCILPFEEEVCKVHGLAATFVGHPMLEDVWELEMDATENGWIVKGNGGEFQSKHGKSSESTIITLLPGSRLQEVERMIPIFSDTMELLKDSFSELTTVVHVAPNRHVEEYVSKAVFEWPVSVVLIPGGSPQLKYDAYSASNVALCTSGTAAIELQLAQ
ncbi:unnamed protein product [Ilex paraguariensis]|uniref:lipid-A-disaccharide synthase n=2 Tax=Ilex paraguariensis TaxID=185542 RepID=A0ABC8R952_9AQUA